MKFLNNLIKYDNIILMIVLLTFYIFIFIIYTAIAKNTKNEVFMFRKDGEGIRRILDDVIDSQEKLNSIIDNPNINQSVSKPEIGASVGFTDGKMYIVKKSKVDTLIKYPLADVPSHDYTQSYFWIPNMYMEFPAPLDLMYVATQEDITNIRLMHSEKPIVNIEFIEIGSILVKNMDGSLYISDTDGFDIESCNPNWQGIALSMDDFLAMHDVRLDVEIEEDLEPDTDDV